MLGAALIAALAACPANVTWPDKDWPSKAEETRASKAAAITALEDYAFTLVGTDAERKGIRTDGVVIIKGGELVYEKYARGFGPTNRHIAWSVTKTLANVLVGRAVQLGKLKIDDGICQTVPVKNGEFCSKLTVRHFLEFSTGLDWNEIYEDESNQRSSVLAMLYGEGRLDMAAFVATHRFRDEPGTTYLYSTGDSTVLAGAARGALEPEYGAAWDKKVLYEPMGMKSALLERDRAGTPAGGSWLNATPRDLARLGYLFLRDGCWKGERLLPENWVRDGAQVSAGFKNKPLERSEGEVYGWQMLVNIKVPEVGQDTLPLPDVPEGTMVPQGHWGQFIAIIPSLDLVIVRTGDDREKAFSRNEFFKLAIEVAK